MKLYKTTLFLLITLSAVIMAQTEKRGYENETVSSYLEKGDSQSKWEKIIARPQ